ncbi:uridine kinase [Pseudonocardia eucalypti]|uniref:gamma-glutamylcyclotransferase n=1 Tax=Pseudonocardia eucalypti TaxID=648755 RepID=UPI0017CC3F5E|nr:uridine kinase [Pseudonocardia eucalypti]
MTRARVLGRVADHLVARLPGRRVRVAVDGVTGAGKTTLAGELAAAVRERGRPAVIVSMDGFHHPRAHRYRAGRLSAEGYYRDAYDFQAFARLVLAPLGPGGNGRFPARIIDLAADAPVDEPPSTAEPDTVLLVDGTFLQRTELAPHWDETIYLDVDHSLARQRAVQRDISNAAVFADADEAERAYRERYHPACRMYADEVDPAVRAGVLIGGDDPGRPELRRIGGAEGATARLFSYGTLQLAAVQREHFGRELAGAPDSLPGYRADWVTITDPEVIAVSGTDRHPIARRTGDPADALPGTVLTLSTTELAAADRYEVDDYRRVQVSLGSGTAAWFYQSSSSP